MEQSWEIIGIVLAVLMVIIGLRLLLKKAEIPAIVKMDELPKEQESQQPIVPRAIREEVITDTSSSQLTEVSVNPTIIETTTSSTIMAESTADVVNQPENLSDSTELQKALIAEPELVKEAEDAIETTSAILKKENEAIVFAKAEMQPLKFEDDELLNEGTVLDAHLSQQDRFDEESALATAQKIVALYVYPNPERALSGERTLKMLLKYGLRYGEMSCFHRYEHPEHPSSLMFSVLRIDTDGAPTGFDLEALPTEEVKGLAFFLALPSSTALQGFDMMASIAGLIARDTEGLVFDEQSLELTPQLRDHWRHFVIEYDPNRNLDA